MRKGIILLLMIVLPLLLVACGVGEAAPPTNNNDVNYEIIDPDSLKEDAIKKWYEDTYRRQGSHSTNSEKEGYKYLLISAGERPTGGYTVEIVDAVWRDGGILVIAELVVPREDEEVTQAISYPHLLLRVEAGEQVSVTARLNEPQPDTKEGDNLQTNITGVYGGQTDENALVITIDEGISFPKNINPVTFEISREIKASGIISELVIGDRVSFDCSFAGGIWEIKRIAKLEAPRQTVSAVFEGWIDNNMFEAMVGGQPTPFWVAEEVKPELEEKAPGTGAEMELTYYEDGYGRLVLTEVEFK